ncbi:universal stress protein [Methanohalophilus portucalensis]|uniref:Universal stress protein n=2 Tax=Methanohalophilus portucalensis TaxID=39664 RepID=A0A1L9C479_9EURY|nr:universal stress protein [Methanohalophilus portucalensis]ATU07895.1 universal stress protein [Methanohalophilus portucalensis]OJH49271.1 UspA domain protein [Methanohalophilus portucalensis FDF-1]RNI11611.1 universal stress protein [Methanohalophilus portucalensis FDF-1]SMH42054.1 Nucleotide-binding universal stress protein, UspA family [Methanohalophilus portucalensis FDF-1]
MIQTILIPTDFTIESEKLLSCIAELKKTGLKKAVLLHVVDIFKSQGLAPMFEENAKKKIAEYKQLLDEMGIDTVTHVVEGDVNKTIIKVADEENVDCIVMGATTSGIIKGKLTGRTTNYISRRSDKILLIEKYNKLENGEEELYAKACSAKFSKVMVPLDFSDNSSKILDVLWQMTDVIHEVVFVHIIENTKNKPQLEHKKKESFDKLYEIGNDLEKKLVVNYVVKEGKPAKVLDELAEEMGITLIMITTHGTESLKDILLGSTAENLLRNTVKPILLIPADNR